MSLGPHAPPPDRDAADDVSIVPGPGRSGRPVPLDRTQDPDRFDPDWTSGPVPEMPQELDPDYDPDRFSVVSRMPGLSGKGRSGEGSAGEGYSLPDLLGTAGTHEGDRDNYEWAYGLLAVLVFLAVVSFLFNNVLSP